MKPGGRDAKGKLEQHIHTRRGKLPVWLSQIIIPILLALTAKRQTFHQTSITTLQISESQTFPKQN